jgi:succinate dehydrogenase/fumarate reductase flavoprotein subunit
MKALRGRRAARQADDRLAAELASYRTEAERAELDAMLSRHSDEEAAKVRQLIG